MSGHAGEERLGPYRLREQLGEGGMGVVYLAADPADRLVAIKALRQGVAADETARKRLAHEVETMRRVASPNVAEVVDADVTGNPPYIVTRYVPGKTLEDVVAAQGPLTGLALTRLAAGLTAALSAVHAAGVVHRDLKPSNVMLVDGEPVVIDFGIAQAADSTRLTMTGMFMGTPGYLAPEVIEGRPSGPAADIHSWGATMAYAATGRPPFGSGTFEAIFYRIVNGQPDLAAMPVPLVPLVLAALARDPARRPAAADLADAVARLDPATLVAGAATSQVPLAAAGAIPRTSPDLSHAATLSAGTGIPGTGIPGVAAAAMAPAAGAAAFAAGAVAPAGTVAPAGAVAPAVGAAVQQPAAWPGTRPLAVRRQEDFADLLPPVEYNGHAPPSLYPGQAGYPGQPGYPGQVGPPPGAPMLAGQQAAVPTGGAGLRAGSLDARPARLPLVIVTFAGLVAASVLWPVAGTAVALALLLLLRSTDLTGKWSGRHPGARGAAAAAFFPVAMLRSALRFVLLLPLAVLCAGGAAAVAVLTSGSSDLPRAAAWAAGALVACYSIGPGSAGCRRPVNRFYGRITRSGLAAAAAFVGVAAVAAVAVTAAATLTPGYWPDAHLGAQLQTTTLAHPGLGNWMRHLPHVGRQVLSWVGHRL